MFQARLDYVGKPGSGEHVEFWGVEGILKSGHPAEQPVQSLRQPHAVLVKGGREEKRRYWRGRMGSQPIR